jgi:hypothetical protein
MGTARAFSPYVVPIIISLIGLFIALLFDRSIATAGALGHAPTTLVS